MESNAENNTLKDILVKEEILNDPDKNTIAVVLNEALRRNFAQASVEWATSYPDLSQPPFNLAAPGICGNTALLDFGDVSYFQLPFTELNVYNFKHFLRFIGRDNSNSFIFGHGIFRQITGHQLIEIVLNALFPPAINGEREKNSSGLVTIDTLSKKCKKKMLELSELQCAVQGTYFLSEGLKTENESVLKVYAKGPYFDKTPFCGSKRFISSMQNALKERFGSENFVALGGVYAVSNVFWAHKLNRNYWEPSCSIRDHYCRVDSQKPEIMITTFNSGTGSHPIIPVSPPIKLNSSQSIHSLSHHSALENYPVIYHTIQKEEYVGYFYPAKTLYRIDEPSQ